MLQAKNDQGTKMNRKSGVDHDSYTIDGRIRQRASPTTSIWAPSEGPGPRRLNRHPNHWGTSNTASNVKEGFPLATVRFSPPTENQRSRRQLRAPRKGRQVEIPALPEIFLTFYIFHSFPLAI